MVSGPTRPVSALAISLSTQVRLNFMFSSENGKQEWGLENKPLHFPGWLAPSTLAYQLLTLASWPLASLSLAWGIEQQPLQVLAVYVLTTLLQ